MLTRMTVPSHSLAELYPGDDRTKTFTLNLSGGVRLYGPEIDVVDAETYQRLDGIRQLGTAHVAFRSATHTRFEHCLGTLSEVQRLIDAVNRNPRATRRIDVLGTRVARLVALLHDLAHVPYAHTLEDEYFLLERHDGNLARRRRLLDDGEIGDILRNALDAADFDLLLQVLGVNPDAVHEIGEYAYVADLVINTVCADALDYIPRDLDRCGMPVAIGDRFLDFFVVTADDLRDPLHRNRMALRLDKRGMPRPDVESEVHKLLEHRYELVERVFFHHAKNAASAMLSRAVQELELHRRDENFDELDDAGLNAILRRPEIGDLLEVQLTDDPAARQRAARLAADLKARRLYKLAYLGIPDGGFGRQARKIAAEVEQDPERRRDIENELAQLAGAEPAAVLLHVPSPRMLAKRGNVRIVLESGEVVLLSEWDDERSGRLQALARAHEQLWRVSVYVDPRVSPEGRRLLTKAAEDRFGLRARYVREPAPSAYLGELFDQFAEPRSWPAHLRAPAIRSAAMIATHARVDGQDVSGGVEAMVDALDIGVERARSQAQRDGRRDEGQNQLFDDER